MGKFIATNFATHQQRIVKKRAIKSGTEKQQSHKSKKLRVEKPVEPEEAASKLPSPPITKELHKDDQALEDSNSEFQNLNFEVVSHPTSGNKYLKLVSFDCDLFAADELNSRYDQYTKYNLIFTVFDEIALEGLDGITLEAYWKRIQIALKLENLPVGLKRVIWQVICLNEEIQFFQLPVARENLTGLDMNFSASRATSAILPETFDMSIDIYKMEQAPKSSGQWGSCATLSTRLDISGEVRKLSLEQAEAMYQNQLVLVADEDLRKNALMDELMDPNYEFSQMEYCLLEKVGRSRALGEVTLGPKSLAINFKLDPKSVYHYGKRLSKEYLISRQFYLVLDSGEHSKVGRLFHLRRFYQRKKTKYIVMLENITDYLKKCPGYRAPYATVRSLFDFKGSVKFFKNQEFLKYVDTNIYLPFREYYSKATYREYMTKSLTKERVIQLMQLKDPYMNIAACSIGSHNGDSSDDDDDDCESDLNNSRHIYNKDYMRDVYQFILSKGHEGAIMRDIHKIFDVDFSGLRMLLKKLTTRKLIQSKKQDVGKQTVNRYVASCLDQTPQLHVNRPSPAQARPSSALEKLKQRQKQKIDALSKERVYTAEQFAADREDQLLCLNTHPLPPATVQIPYIMCKYLIAEARQPQNVPEFDIFLAQLKAALEPFRINLSLPAGSFTPNLRNVSLDSAGQTKYVFKEPSEELGSRHFRSDYFSKAFLLQALLDKVQIDKKIIDFLDLNKPSKRAGKRPIESEAQKEASEKVKVAKKVFGMYMGSNPVLVLNEKDDTSKISMDIHASTPIDDYKTGDITQYNYDPSVAMTERVLSRILIILRTIQEQQVFEEVNLFLKLIYQEESKAGYDKRIDRKSLHRLFNRLTNEGYVKIFIVHLTTSDSQKTQTYVCHPQVTPRHHQFQECLRQFKEKMYCYMNKLEEPVSEPVKKEKPPEAERSPFIEDDVLQSLSEIKALTQTAVKAKSSVKAGKFYGRRPKFARLSLMHELLFYLIYELDKDTQPLPKAEVAELFKNFNIRLTEADLKKLPPVYCREISWKTFMPPLPYHQGWDQGWALLVDVILRMPITLITRCYSVNFVSAELQEILQHPVKRFYLLRNLSPSIRTIIMHRRNFIHDMFRVLILLSYCGLAQFGPSSFRDKEKSFFYLNRRATLWDTTTSAPGYQRIEKKEYPKITFYFANVNDVLKYWSTMNNICINTNLTARRVMEGKTITLVDSNSKPSLNKARAVRTAKNVNQFDTGLLPGDHKGAAGLDSSLSSHIQRSWHFFSAKNEHSFTEPLDSLKLNEVVNSKVAFDKLKLPATTSHKYYIVKPPDLKHTLLSRKVKTSKGGKKKPIKRKVTVFRRKPSSERALGLDSIDKATMRRTGGLRYRPKWTKQEDKLLILLKVASAFITPGTAKQIITYPTIRDVLFIVEPLCRDKTTRSICNRLKTLQAAVPFLANIESLIPNLYKLLPIAKYFVPLRKLILHGSAPVRIRRKYQLPETDLLKAFIFLAHYFLKHQTEVEVSLHGKNTTTDYFNEENIGFYLDTIEPYEKKDKIYLEPLNEIDIRRYTLRNTIQSALSHKRNKQGWSIQMYQIYQKFSEQVLKAELNELKNARMIQFKKERAKPFFTPYRLAVYYIFAQSATFMYHTMEEAYQTFLDLKYNPEDVDYSYEAMEEKKYGQLFGLNEMLSCMLSDVRIQLDCPEHHLILNPKVEDHSDVIDELARRYQAKLKSDQKDSELQVELQTSSKNDDEDVEMSEPEPGLSTAPREEPEFEFIPFDDDEPLDLSITAKNSTTIDNLKHWISDCIDAERVRSPSPELLNLEINKEADQRDTARVESKPASVKEEDRLLTLEEIKEEMLKPPGTSEKRSVPYVSDLTKLLFVNFEEIEHDERAVYLMKKHFVQRYPALEKVTVEGLDTHYLSKFWENRTSIKDAWSRIEREAHVDAPSDAGVAFDEILEKGGTMEDVSLANEMLHYVQRKENYGATGFELKQTFLPFTTTCSLELILRILTDHHILLRTGVCAVRFVHCDYQYSWLTDTFKLTPEQAQLLPNKKTTGKDPKKLDDDDVQSTDITKWIKIKPLPWFSVEGALDKNMVKMWLSQVFSYCIENPHCPLMVVCEKFCFLKPVDVFYLVEVLEEIGGLEMRQIRPESTDLFSEYASVDDRKATFLDNFEEIYVEPNNICFVTVGSFLDSV